MANISDVVLVHFGLSIAQLIDVVGAGLGRKWPVREAWVPLPAGVTAPSPEWHWCLARVWEVVPIPHHCGKAGQPPARLSLAQDMEEWVGRASKGAE